MQACPDSALVYSDEWIAKAYQALVDHTGLTLRASQVKLSRVLARCFLLGRPVLAEAPTGTGKTLAYLVAGQAADATRAAFSVAPKQLVVATATIGLQQQLLAYDLPKMAKAGLLSMSSVVFYKGRGNFVCRRAAEAVVRQAVDLSKNPELSFLGDEHDYEDPKDLREILADLRSGQWDGDLTLREGRPKTGLQHVVVQDGTCIGNKCPYASSCGFQRMRKSVPHARVVVANHDVVMASWAAREIGAEPALNADVADLVIDEGHHLPGKALAAGTRQFALTRMHKQLPGALAALERVVNSARTNTAIATEVTFPLWGAQSEASLQQLDDDIRALELAAGETVRLRGSLEPNLEVSCEMAGHSLRALAEALSRLSKACAEKETATTAEGDLMLFHASAEVVRRCAPLLDWLPSAIQCVQLLQQTKNTVRWIDINEQDEVELNASPLEASAVLGPWMWEKAGALTPAVLSATLRTDRGFEYFRSQIGAPETAHEVALPHVFPYEHSRIVLAAMKASPKMDQRKDYVRELKAGLLRHIDPQEGTLVLFTSWTMLKEVTPALQEVYGDALLLQGQAPMSSLVKRHRARIDAGQGSILAGVATLSEGLDLPGKYCEHVCITALPFAVPTTPIEQELQDALGDGYFGKRSLPAATVRLIQMVGRLVRRETDSGRVTMFDSRLRTTGYGRSMLKALPPMRITHEDQPTSNEAVARAQPLADEKGGFSIARGQAPRHGE